MLLLSMNKAYQCDQFSNQTDVGAEQALCDCHDGCGRVLGNRV